MRAARGSSSAVRHFAAEDVDQPQVSAWKNNSGQPGAPVDSPGAFGPLLEDPLGVPLRTRPGGGGSAPEAT
jgi:hypothetical protein